MSKKKIDWDTLLNGVVHYLKPYPRYCAFCISGNAATSEGKPLKLIDKIAVTDVGGAAACEDCAIKYFEKYGRPLYDQRHP